MLRFLVVLQSCHTFPDGDFTSLSEMSYYSNQCSVTAIFVEVWLGLQIPYIKRVEWKSRTVYEAREWGGLGMEGMEMVVEWWKGRGEWPRSHPGKGKGDEMKEATGRVGLNEILSLL